MEVDARSLGVFLVVADTLHFGRAAERLRIAQPSVSAQIARLETRVGAQLFVRGPRGVALTPTGQRLVRLVAPPLQELDHALKVFLADLPARRRLQVGVLSSLSPLVAASAASIGTEIDLHEGPLPALTQLLRAGEIDIAFCYDTRAEAVFEGFRVEQVDERASRVAVPTSDPLRAEPFVGWADASERNWIMPSASRQYHADMLARFTRRGLTPQVVAEATTLTGQLGLVAAGIGWTFTSPWAALPAGVAVLKVDDPDRLKLLGVTRKREDAPAAPAVSDLIDAVKRAAAEVP